jgi:hypothetical protein
VVSGSANADLTVIGTATYQGNEYNLIYEDDQELVWLDYSFPNNRWPQQMQTISALNDPGVLTLSLNPDIKVSWKGDWRLPATLDGPRKNGYDGSTTAGFNIATSEMGHLFYTSLGNPGYYDTKGNPRPGWGKPKDQQTWGLKNTGPFENLRHDNYWSSTEYGAYPEQHAWDFNTYFGAQDCESFKGSYSFSGLAVRSGKVAGR